MKTFTKRVFISFAILFAFQCIVADDSAPITSDKAMLEYVVANATVCPVRENPSEAAEQATQLLFGEVCEVIERLSSWTKIRSIVDGQVGWVSSSMLTPASNLIASSPRGCRHCAYGRSHTSERRSRLAAYARHPSA